MRTTLLVVLCVSIATVAPAADELQVLSWADGATEMLVENPGGSPLAKTVLTIEDPGVTGAAWALSGTVRCQGVAGEGYLEMWSHTPQGQAFFSRTIAMEGPMGRLAGDQDTRPFVLVMQGQPGGPAPAKLVLNVVLPGEGSVWLGPVRLAQADTAGELVSLASAGGDAWFTDAQGGWVGAIGGGLLGLLGTLIGLGCFLGRGRRFVLAGLVVIVVIGLACLGAGTAALLATQPYAVYYPFLLLGGLCLSIGLAGYFVARRRYQALELRRMRAMDAA
jgi:hypothetical protein